MIVVDASVFVNILVYDTERGSKARSALDRDPEWAAPEHWKMEVFSVLRGLVLGGKVSADLALTAVSHLPSLGVDHVPVDDLLLRMWQLRGNISAYDLPYVALAEQRDLTLVTADARLARTAIRHCRVDLVS